MIIKIKDWKKFQHFKDRTPPWVKLYRDLLDDPDWHELDGRSAKVLTMLWLIASEDETQSGTLPCIRKLSFRLRMKESEVKQELEKLSHWLISERYHDDITAISGRYHDDTPETETEAETETEKTAKTEKSVSTDFVFPEDFLIFWKSYPQAMRKEKQNALKAWKSALKAVRAEEILACLESAKRGWSQRDGFVPSPPYPAKWLKNAPWLDSTPEQRELELGVSAQTEVPGQPLWSAVRRDIEQHVGPGVFAGLIAPLKCSIDKNIVVLQTASKFQQQHITQQYGSLIKNLFAKHDQKIIWGGIKHGS